MTRQTQQLDAEFAIDLAEQRIGNIEEITREDLTALYDIHTVIGFHLKDLEIQLARKERDSGV